MSVLPPTALILVMLALSLLLLIPARPVNEWGSSAPGVHRDCPLAPVRGSEHPPGALRSAAGHHDLHVVGREHADRLVWLGLQSRRVRFNPCHGQWMRQGLDPLV